MPEGLFNFFTDLIQSWEIMASKAEQSKPGTMEDVE
jgi:hypothetical protein